MVQLTTGGFEYGGAMYEQNVQEWQPEADIDIEACLRSLPVAIKDAVRAIDEPRDDVSSIMAPIADLRE